MVGQVSTWHDGETVLRVHLEVEDVGVSGALGEADAEGVFWGVWGWRVTGASD